jgi:hypothetical protein
MLKMMAAGKDPETRQPVTIVVFGLSHKNLDKLKDGWPIKIDGDELNLPGFKFFIFTGPTEDLMMEEVQDMIGPETEIRIKR